MHGITQAPHPQLTFATKLGFFHPVYCEDFVCAAEIGNGKWIAGAFDGCTMGTESHFASALAGKILRKVAKEAGYEYFADPSLESQPLEILGRDLLGRFRHQFRKTCSDLFLTKEEQLTTLVIALVDTRANAVWGICAGDGYVSTPAGAQEFDHGNIPNYMAYHWDKTFEEWLEGHTGQFHFEEVREVTLSTDGIFAFERMDKTVPFQEVDVVDFILGEGGSGPKAISNQINVLEQDYGLVATDDVGVVRLRW